MKREYLAEVTPDYESPLAQGRGLKLGQQARSLKESMSPLAQGRGLKHGRRRSRAARCHVAPRAGAWIETDDGVNLNRAVRSPLAQGRGLKHTRVTIDRIIDKSPLAQGRGLKRC